MCSLPWAVGNYLECSSLLLHFGQTHRASELSALKISKQGDSRRPACYREDSAS